MQLSQEIEKVFAKLNRGLIESEVACCAVEQLIYAHMRKPVMQLDCSIRSVLERMRMRAADDVDIQAEIMAWSCSRADDYAEIWL